MYFHSSIHHGRFYGYHLSVVVFGNITRDVTIAYDMLI